MESFLKKKFKKIKAHKTTSAAQTMAVSRLFAAGLKHGDVVALSGDLGAGKTHFVKGVAVHFGISKIQVVSPTFSLLKSHKGHGVEIYHFDFYRLKGMEELEKTGYRDCLIQGDSIVFVEWPEIVQETWSDFTYAVTIKHAGENKREIVLYGRKTGARKKK